MNASTVEAGVYSETTEMIPEESKLSKWTTWATWLAVKVGFTLAVFSVASIVVTRWVKYGLYVAQRAIWEHANNLYGLLDAISPSPTEVEREEKKEKIVGKIEEIFQQLSLSDFVWFDLGSVWMWLGLIAGGTTICLGALVMLKSSLKSGKRIVQRIRGIHFESVREGSDFRVAPIPTSQVAVMEPGLLTDTHLGYGMRYNDYLVSPRHVFEKNGELVKEILLKGTKGKVLALVNPVDSRAVDDLVYVFLDQKTWSVLGTSKGKWSRKVVSTHSTCVGASGASTGRIAKTPVRWMISFGGSTIPGMSGAGYVSNGEIQGIHQGASGPYNVGFAAALVVGEMSLVCAPEDSGDTNPDAVKPRFLAGNQKLWKEIDAMEDLAEKYAHDDWTRNDAVDYNQRLVFSDDEESARKRVKKTNPLSVELPAGGIRLKGQSGDGETIESVIVTRSDAQYLRKLMEARIVERVEALEGRMSPKEKTTCAVCGIAVSKDRVVKHMENSHPQRHPCDQCDIVARTAEKLAKHVANSHPVKKESAIPSDTGARGKVIKQGSFLGKRSSSPKSSRKSSSLSSSRSSSSNRLPQVEDNLSQMISSQRSIESSLKELLAVMRGQSSEAKQS